MTGASDRGKRVAGRREAAAKEGAWPEAAGQSSPQVNHGQIDLHRQREGERWSLGEKESERVRQPPEPSIQPPGLFDASQPAS